MDEKEYDAAVFSQRDSRALIHCKRLVVCATLQSSVVVQQPSRSSHQASARRSWPKSDLCSTTCSGDKVHKPPLIPLKRVAGSGRPPRVEMKPATKESDKVTRGLHSAQTADLSNGVDVCGVSHMHVVLMM